MTVYWIVLVTTSAAALIGGYAAGARYHAVVQSHSRRFAAGGLILALVWFVLGWWARNYAETDGFGWAAAEWFAHSGKWFVFLVAALTALSFALATEINGGFGTFRSTAPEGGSAKVSRHPSAVAGGRPEIIRRIVFAAFAVAVAAAVFHRTVPIYPWLDEGRRDHHGLMRQSLRYEFTCAAVALANYLERFQGKSGLTEQEIARDCGTTREGSTQSGILRAARRHGLERVARRKLSSAELNESTLPAIVSISTMRGVRHATLLVRVDGKTAFFLDPAYGEWSVSRTRFDQIWYGQTVVLSPR